MYKKLFIAAAVAAMFAGCTKNEVNPVETPDQEITYQAILSPKTKAGELVFNTSNVFQSTAYRYLDGALVSGKYIDAATISFDGTNWKDASNSYYWPKTGTLTFHSWTIDKSVLSFSNAATTVSVNATDGVSISNFDVKADPVNFMIAEVAADKTGNETAYGFTGVPTLFKHMLCKVKCVVKAGETNPDGTLISVKSLSFKNVVKSGNLTKAAADWTLGADKDEFAFTVAGTELAKGAQVASDEVLFIPQVFTSDDQVLYIKYTVKDNKGVTSEYEQSVPLSTTGLFDSAWAKNKFYTLTLTIGLDEILWAPVEEDWIAGTGSWTVTD